MATSTVGSAHTLNLLRTSRIDPTKSADDAKYDWNKHPMPHLALDRSYMKPLIAEHHGDPVTHMPGIVAKKWTIIEIASFMCLKHAHIVLLVHLTYFLNIACCPSSHPSSMAMKCKMN